MPLYTKGVTINRMVGSLGWLLTNNIMMKAEYVNQKYENFAATDIRSNAEFEEFMVEAPIGF
ncbi:MAG: hypothetical protein ACKVQV_11485 [Bacteroidia bacterium]